MRDPDERDFAPTEHLHGHASAMQGIPDDARMMGLDRNTEEGALVAMAGSLDRRKPSHQVVAWIAIIALAAPAVLTVFALLF